MEKVTKQQQTCVMALKKYFASVTDFSVKVQKLWYSVNISKTTWNILMPLLYVTLTSTYINLAAFYCGKTMMPGTQCCCEYRNDIKFI